MAKSDEVGHKPSRAKAKCRIQDIHAWIQCFALYVAVRAKQSPKLTPELMAYLVAILRASQEYEGSAWLSYDTAYRRQAAATGYMQWYKVNRSLYGVFYWQSQDSGTV